MEMQGQVALNDAQQDAAASAVVGERPLRENLSYAEGGNVLRGTGASGEPYALVGRDTVALTQERLRLDLGRPVSEAEARSALAYDLGLQSSQVHPVEQPGDFHLDMQMLPLRDGRIVVNDSREAAELQAQWLRQDAGPEGMFASGLERRIAQLRQDAERRAVLEDRSADELRAAGFTVHRMAGVFPSTGPSSQPMNFLNTEGGVGADGGSFLVMLGGDRRAQDYVTSRLTNDIPSGIDRLYFLPDSVNRNLLLMGGLNCRVKGDGVPISAAEARQRSDSNLRSMDVINLNCPVCHAPRSSAPTATTARREPAWVP